MTRAKLRPRSEKGGAYFASPKTDVKFVSSGCKLIDLVMGGGYPLGRIVNLVGDKSTGKTLLAIEVCANFAAKFPRARIYYNEVEAAFDKEYAAALGLPVDRVKFIEGCDTVEQLFASLEKVCGKDTDEPSLYIVDSLDAISDAAELNRAIDEASYGGSKAKQMSQLFRRIVRKLEEKRVTLVIISQVRDAIGVTFGRKTSRSGGRALDFYASIVLYLAQIGRIKRTVNKVERKVGVNIRIHADKNKIGLPFRECDVPILFGYGIDDIAASVAWLEEVGKLPREVKDAKRFIRDLDTLSPGELKEWREILSGVVEQAWYEIEQGFLPTRKKYT